MKKNYDKLQEIKQQILNKYNDKIEWLEIETVGTKYVIKLELRKIILDSEDTKYRHIISSKSAIIKKIVAQKGEVIKEINDYVNKGDIVISGEIKLNESIKGYTKAEGSIYGEVWYEVKTEYPFHYKEVKETGNSKKIYVINFLNKSIELSFKKYKEKRFKEKEILSFYPFKIVKQYQNELQIIDNIYTEEEVIKKAVAKAEEKILNKLDKDEYIIYKKILLINVKDSKIELDMFFSVYENITEYIEIKEK